MSEKFTPAQAVRESWDTYRTLDPIRACALQAATSIYRLVADLDDPDHAQSTIALAKTFEQYLTGEEADGRQGD